MEHYFTNNPNLKSELRNIIYKCQGTDINFYSDNGVFSKDKLDFGSTLLLEAYFENCNRQNLTMLDLGCGYGFIGITMAKMLGYRVTMCDVNKRALHLANKNVELNGVGELAQVIQSDVYENIEDKYDLIMTNPPIRAGKEVVYRILDDAKKHLTSNGELWIVIRKDQGAKSTLKHLENEYKCEIITKSKGFYIIKAENH